MWKCQSRVKHGCPNPNLLIPLVSAIELGFHKMSFLGKKENFQTKEDEKQ